MEKPKTIKIDYEMVKVLEIIRKQEKDRGGSDSWRIASKILAIRINRSGGIKELQ